MPSSSRFRLPHGSITFGARCNAFVFILSVTILYMRVVLKLVWGGGFDCFCGRHVQNTNCSTACRFCFTFMINVLSLSAVSGHTVIQSQGVVFNMYRFLKVEGESGPGEKWVQGRVPRSCGVSFSTVQCFLQESTRMWESKGFWSLLKYDHIRRRKFDMDDFDTCIIGWAVRNNCVWEMRWPDVKGLVQVLKHKMNLTSYLVNNWRLSCETGLAESQDAAYAKLQLFSTLWPLKQISILPPILTLMQWEKCTVWLYPV